MKRKNQRGKTSHRKLYVGMLDSDISQEYLIKFYDEVDRRRIPASRLADEIYPKKHQAIRKVLRWEFSISEKDVNVFDLYMENRKNIEEDFKELVKWILEGKYETPDIFENRRKRLVNAMNCDKYAKEGRGRR